MGGATKSLKIIKIKLKIMFAFNCDALNNLQKQSLTCEVKSFRYALIQDEMKLN